MSVGEGEGVITSFNVIVFKARCSDQGSSAFEFWCFGGLELGMALNELFNRVFRFWGQMANIFVG